MNDRLWMRWDRLIASTAFFISSLSYTASTSQGTLGGREENRGETRKKAGIPAQFAL